MLFDSISVFLGKKKPKQQHPNTKHRPEFHRGKSPSNLKKDQILLNQEKKQTLPLPARPVSNIHHIACYHISEKKAPEDDAVHLSNTLFHFLIRTTRKVTKPQTNPPSHYTGYERNEQQLLRKLSKI